MMKKWVGMWMEDLWEVAYIEGNWEMDEWGHLHYQNCEKTHSKLI